MPETTAMDAVTEHRITEWLARAHPAPQQAYREWAQQSVALLPCGVAFAAVRIPAELVQAATGHTTLPAVAEVLAAALDGPVIHDGRDRDPYYVLIQWHAGIVWAGAEDTPCLGEEYYLGVPHIRLRQPPGPHWAVPPKREGDLCRPSLVTALIEEGRAALAAATPDA